MSDLAIIARYAKEHGMTYGKVALALNTGELTHEEVGIKKPDPLMPPQKKQERLADPFTFKHTCAVCGKVFMSGKQNARTCSSACAHVYWGVKPKKEELVYIKRAKRIGKKDTCVICGAVYCVENAAQLTCCEGCAYKYRVLPPFERNRLRKEKAEQMEREAQNEKEK